MADTQVCHYKSYFECGFDYFLVNIEYIRLSISLKSLRSP